MTRTNALLVVLAILALSAGYADVKVFDIGGSLAGDQRANTSSLCSLRADVQQRVASTVAFLGSHPHGIPGISRREIRASLANEQATLHALRPLAGHCTSP